MRSIAFVAMLLAGQREPDWTGMIAKLQELHDSSQTVWGGMFYPATLIAAKSKNGSWKTFRKLRTAQQKADRDVHVFQSVWTAMCKDNTAKAHVAAHQRCSTTCWQQRQVQAARAAFAEWYNSFYKHMTENTKGYFSDYSMKCILDVGCNCSIQATR